MRFPRDAQLDLEMKQYQLRSACCHCLFFLSDPERCGHGWPLLGQQRWPLDPAAREIDFCKEFELF